ncbi:hypothetical protein SNE40_009028 [Patella caerulea]|uniref:U4/U6.U5 tri-snRNP-associated protein 1 n=1 Tax=Patella caerulea TaxID=87958 RepID=A0AAN8JND5_PATCE
MGTSKKHKERDREHKRKHKHRDRSRSRSRSKERSDKHRRRERRQRQETAPVEDDIEYIGTTPAEENIREPPIDRREVANVGAASSGGGESLSVEETNRLRAKLGLKPLDVGGSSGAGNDGAPVSKDEDVHAPAVNWAEQKKTESLREKMAVMREKRLINQKLGKVKTLGDSDSDDDGVLGWVKKSRKLEKEKQLAAKRAKLLEEMDEEFGIADLVEDEFKPTKKNYTSKDLKGLKVKHEANRFKEGKTVILTLQDKGILDEEDADELINVNMLDDEVVDRNLENKKKKPDYKPYDEPEYDEYGVFKPKTILEKYDEEIDGKKAESFEIGGGGKYDGLHEKQMSKIRAELKKQEQSLSLSAPQLASEYYTHDEMDAKFKKVKKKVRKIRKLKADDLLPLPDDELNIDAFQTPNLSGTNHIPGLTLVKQVMEVDPQEEDDLSGVQVEDDGADELHSALTKARKLKIKKERDNRVVPEKVAEMVQKSTVKKEKSPNKPDSNIILNSTSEFCRNLGEIPTYGLAGNREEERDEIMDMELEIMEQKRRQEEEDNPSGWNEVDIDDQPVDIMGEESAVLEEEPIVSEGVGAALQLAMKKGYLEKEMIKPTTSKRVDLEAKNYSIEDKRYDDLDEKFRKRDRYAGGVVSDFKDKDGYKPNVKLEYVDEKGRDLDPKEAFRQLSHRFHGKGSGKKKTEKRNKKLEEEQLMKQMSSTDTPLNTLSMLQDKQKTEKSPFIILSGSKGLTAGHSIMKSR